MMEFESSLILNDINPKGSERKGIETLKLLTYKHETIKKLNKGLKKVQKSFELEMHRPDIELEIKRRREKLKMIEASNPVQIRYDFRKKSEFRDDDEYKVKIHEHKNIVAIDSDMFDLHKTTNQNILDKLGGLKRSYNKFERIKNINQNIKDNLFVKRRSKSPRKSNFKFMPKALGLILE